jgi:hypothetical protein
VQAFLLQDAQQAVASQAAPCLAHRALGPWGPAQAQQTLTQPPGPKSKQQSSR